MSKKENSKDIVLNSLEAFQRLILGFMPGGHVVDEFLNFRSNLKRNRILKFSNSLNNFLKDFKGEGIDPIIFTSEEFVDIFDSIINKVQMTNSSIKLQCFRNIILSQITDSSANEILSNKIIQTIDELNDLQLISLMIVSEQESLSTIYDIHLKFKMKNVYIKLSNDDHPPANISMEDTLDSSIFLYFLDELIHMGLITEVETDGNEIIPSNEMKEAYQNYIERKKRLSNSSIVYVPSSYGRLICEFIKTPEFK